jgi:hypothetical protein
MFGLSSRLAAGRRRRVAAWRGRDQRGRDARSLVTTFVSVYISERDVE